MYKLRILLCCYMRCKTGVPLIAYSFVLQQGVVFAIFHCFLDDEVTRHPPFITFVFEKLSISGSVGKARVAKWWKHSPPSYQCGPGSNPGVDAICGVEFVVGSLPCSGEVFSPGTPVFPSPYKPTLPVLKKSQVPSG